MAHALAAVHLYTSSCSKVPLLPRTCTPRSPAGVACRVSFVFRCCPQSAQCSTAVRCHSRCVTFALRSGIHNI